jgi:protein-disulfide isomerase
VIDADQQLARSLGASGTPSFFINGRSLRGAQPFDAFKTVIDTELKAKG